MSAELEAKIRELEDTLTRVTANRDDILREKRDLEGRQPPKLSETDRLLRAADRVLKINYGVDQYQTDRVIIPRRCPPAEYQRLKAEAEQRGVPYEVAEADADPALSGHARPAESNIRFVEDEKTFFAHQAMQREVGIIELDRRAKAKGKVLRVFRTPDDLSPDARALHDRLVAEGDPDNLLLPGGE
jgi:hypothetical protein